MHTKTPNNPQKIKTLLTIPKIDGATNKPEINNPSNLKNKTTAHPTSKKKQLLI